MQIADLRKLLLDRYTKHTIMLEKIDDEELGKKWDILRVKGMSVGGKFLTYEEILMNSHDKASESSKYVNKVLGFLLDDIIKLSQNKDILNTAPTEKLNPPKSTELISISLPLDESGKIIEDDKPIHTESTELDGGTETVPQLIHGLKIESGSTIEIVDSNPGGPLIQPEDHIKEESEDSKKEKVPLKNRMKNAKVGEFYSDKLELGFLENEIDKDKVSVEGINNFNLILNKETFYIEGTPSKPGKDDDSYDIEFTVRFYLKDGLGERLKLYLKIFPDPKSLWKNIESDKNDKYFKNDTEAIHKFACFGETQTYSITAASVRGRSHAHTGAFRDDHFIVDYDEDKKWTLLIVADGAGTAKYSRKGSQLACEEAQRLIREKLSSKDYINIIHQLIKGQKKIELKEVFDELISFTIYRVAEQIDLEAKANKAMLKDYHTTFLLAFIVHLNENLSFIYTWSVGDGAICHLRSDLMRIDLLNNVDGGEFSGQTRFLTMPEVIQTDELRKRAKITLVDKIDMIFLMTDGISDPLFETDNNLEKYELWANLANELKDGVLTKSNPDQELLRWCEFWSEGNHDDRTITVYKRKELED